MSKPSDTELQIRDMAKLTMLENKINDVQVQNLRMFALVFFDGVVEAQIDYDFAVIKPAVEYEEDVKKLDIKYKFKKPEHNSKVIYNLTLDSKHENASMDRRFEALTTSVRNLFWKEVKVIVYLNGKLAFETKNG